MGRRSCPSHSNAPIVGKGRGRVFVRQPVWLETDLADRFLWSMRKARGALVCQTSGLRKLRGLWAKHSPSRLRWMALDMQIGCAALSSKWTVVDDENHLWPAGYGKDVKAETVNELCKLRQVTAAVEALGVLVRKDCPVSKSLVYAVLKECLAQKDLPLGRRVHALTVKKGYESDTFLCTQIVRMYGSRAGLQEAMDVFDKVAKPDVFTWSAIIFAHVKQGQDKLAIQLYHRMRRSDVTPDGYVFVAALQACARKGDLISGQQIHADILVGDVRPTLFVWNCLVDMYAKCGSLEDARRVFDGLGDEKDVVTWSTIIAGYSQHGMGEEALHLYSVMEEEGIVEPNSVTFVSLLQACACVGTRALERAKQLHAQIRERGHDTDVYVGNSLINMYAKCGNLEDARRVFDQLGQKNVVTWTTLMAGYSHQGMGQEALLLYSRMQEEGMSAPDSVTFVCLLQACANVGMEALETGKQLHVQLRERGHQADLSVANSLVNMYAKCGSLRDAQLVFDRLGEKDVVTWNAMIAGYVQKGMGQDALDLYSAMEEGTVVPTSVTFICLLQACGTVGTSALGQGKQLHAQIRQCGLQTDAFVGNCLVDMYTKCGSLEEAGSVFDELGQKDVVTWTAMITGYSQQGMGEEALRLYLNMQDEGIITPDSVTFACLLQVCANVAALQLGRQIHAHIKEQGLQDDLFIASSLINMYAKSGSMVDAQHVFDALPERNVVIWSALIAGYTSQGRSEIVFDLIRTMIVDGIQPDSITFLCLLTVCSHTGLLEKGQEYFDAMSRHHGIRPTVEHYTCMVDLLGRAGRLEESLSLIKTMPVPPNASTWHTLLGACQKWSNLEIGLLAFAEALKLDEKDAAAYVLMSNVYAGAQMWEQAREIQGRRIGIGARKQRGQSWWTDMDGLVNSFSVGDTKHLGSE